MHILQSAHLSSLLFDHHNNHYIKYYDAIATIHLVNIRKYLLLIMEDLYKRVFVCNVGDGCFAHFEVS